MSKVLRLWPAIVFVLLPAGCQRGAMQIGGDDIQVELAVSPQPPAVGPVTVTVTLRDPAGRPVAGATVEVEGNMSHAGMAPVPAAAPEVEPGRYQARLALTMAGDWFFLVRAALPDGRQIERQIDVPGVRP